MRLTCLSCVLLAAASLPAQTLPMLPAPPAGVVYRYWSRQLVQWLPADSPYSMIELDVDDRVAQPLYRVVLTSHAGARAEYTNQPGELAWERAAGADVHLVPIALEGPAEPANGATYLLRFATEKNVPVVWQFVQGSDVSERGSGLTVVNAPSPIFLYREQGAVAGEGTALKVGNSTYTAEVWKEISQPPYFVAYHGALSQDVHVLAFVAHPSEWKIDPPTATMAPGAQWTLTSTRSPAAMRAHVTKLSGEDATVVETGVSSGVEITLDEHRDGDAWRPQRVRYAAGGLKGDHSVTLTFAPGGTFELLAGKKTHLGAGTVSLANTPAGVQQTWSFTQPAEAARQPVQATAGEVR